MAWYRCGGGGIPSSLKGDMNDVFNKKFGTVLQDYPPEDWPGTVNLMGPLPEKTVSGSVVAFSDGADDVPLKSCKVTIAPNLDGVSSVDVVQTGLNLFNRTHTDTANGYADNRYLGASGAGQTSQNFIVSEYTEIDAGKTITISNASGNSPSIVFYNASKQVISGVAYANQSTITITVPENTVYFRASVPKVNLETYQIEYGSRATTPTTHTATLGRTIYGGIADVVNGTGTDGFTRWQLKDITWIREETIGGFFVFVTTTISNKALNYNFECEGYTNAQTYRNNLQDKQIGTYNATNGRNRFAIRDDTYTTVEAFIEAQGDNYVVYENNAPEDFTFDPIPINSWLGDNTMWGDGDLSVTYRRDIDLALGGG